MEGTDKIYTSLIKAIDYYLTRKFKEALESLDAISQPHTNRVEMWKLIILAEKTEEDVLKETQKLLSVAQNKNDEILEIGALCAQILSLSKIRKFDESVKLVEDVLKKISGLPSEGDFEKVRLNYLIQIISGSAYLGIANFKKSAEFFERVFFSELSNKYLWHKLRAAYTILFGERDKGASPKLIKIAEEAVSIARELNIGDNIRIHFRNLVRMQVFSNQNEKAKETYKQMFSSYERSSVTPEIVRDFSLDLEKGIQILQDAKEKFSKQPIVIDLPADSYLFVGDIHGDLEALIRAFTIWEDKYDHIIFIGDIVDYGGYQLECLILMSKLMLEFPERVHMLRGNHETELICKFYGFAIETYVRHRKEILDYALKMFKEMPIAAVIDNRIFCIHGGVGGNEKGEVVQLPEIRNFKKRDELGVDLYQVLWNDPSEDFDDTHNFFERGFRGNRTRIFGRRAVEEFCSKSNIETIIRAHSRFDEGYKKFFDGKMWSLFSSKYWDPKISPKVLGWNKENFRIFDLWKDVEFGEKFAKKLLDKIKK
ncbi:MAG: metallophosphoesterase [Candidatus Heimdallarchaeaceae archaeon]|jgi:tetratricopeptide (TPR) repeat protein